jgi:hypothetical protein
MTLSFKRALYPTADLIDLSRRVVNSTGSIFGQDPKGAALAGNVEISSKNLAAAVEREKTNPRTAAIYETDQLRDECMILINDTIRGNTHNVLDPAKKAAATALRAVLTAHAKGVIRKGMGLQSNKVLYVLEILTSEENNPRCALLELEPVIAKLAELQKKLEDQYTQKLAADQSSCKLTVTGTAPELVAALRKYFGYVEAIAAVDKDSFGGLLQSMKDILTDMETIVRSRRTKAQNGENKTAIAQAA